MGITRERISFTFDPRDMLLSLQIVLSFVRDAVACTILVRISGFETSYLCPFILISLWMPLALFVISSIFSALSSISLRFCRDFQLGLLIPVPFQLKHLCRWQTADCDISVANANLSIMFFQSIRHKPFEKNVEDDG